MSETIVQKKTAKLIQRNLSELISRGNAIVPGTLITVSIVRVTKDLSLAKVYITTLPDGKLGETVEILNENSWEIRKNLAARIKNNLRKMPDLTFYADDSFSEAEKIDSLLEKIEQEKSSRGESPESPSAPE